jgi:hypothetical protein
MKKLKRFIVRQGYTGKIESVKVVYATTKDEAKQFECDGVWSKNGAGIRNEKMEVADVDEGPHWTEVKED